MIKMIAIDLDGTLLNDENNISDYSISVLEKCKSRGIKTAIVTARYLKHAERCVKLVNPDITIACLGALAVNNNFEPLYSKTLPVETVNGIIKEFLDDGDFRYFSVAAEKNFYVRNARPAENPDYSFREQYDFSVPLSQKSYMIGVESPTSEKTMKIEMIAGKFTECKILKFFPSTRTMLVHKEAGKFSALKACAELENIRPNEIAVFGDDYPDIEMIKECGIGVAMGNAIDEVTTVADQVCQSNNDDGVAKWIEKNILEVESFAKLR